MKMLDAGAFGIMGALLATPVIATGNLIFRYVYRKILEDQPVTAPGEDKPGIMDKVRGFVSRLRQSFVRGTQPTPDMANVTVQPDQKVE
jgi:hypothetical protein